MLKYDDYNNLNYWKDGIVIGYLKFKVLWDDTPFIEFLYVNEEHRNKGIGTELLKRFIEDHSYYHGILISTETRFSRSESLYKRIGFEECGQIIWPKNDFNEKLFFYSNELK